MKLFKTILLIIITAILGGTNSVAQDLTGEIVSNKLQDKAQILNDCLLFLAQKDRSSDIKKHYMNQALSLFVNNGKPFSVDSMKYDGAYIITKSEYRNKPVKRKIKDYLQGVLDLRYTPIDLSTIKIPALPAVIDNKSFVKCGDNLYKYTTLITRELAGYIDGTPVYKDITPFEYSVFIGIKNTIDGREYIIYLSDIEVEEKEDNKNKPNG